MLNYRQLHYFREVAKAGGITRAAKRLHLTPQTISAQLSEFERTLGIELFRRSGRRLELTAAGEQALSHADEIFQLGGELEALLRIAKLDRGDRFGQLVTVGADVVGAVSVEEVGAGGEEIVYELLSAAMHLTEPVHLFCHEDKLERLFAELPIHMLELVIADRPLPSDLGVKGYSHILGRSATAFLAAPELAGRYRDRFPQSLDGAPLLIQSSSAALRGMMEDWFSSRHIRPAVVGEFDDTALMKAFGQAGTGIFPVAAVVAEEIQRQYHVEMVGITTEVMLKYYAISLERRLTHPAVVAVSNAARQALFIENRRSNLVAST